MAQQYRSDIVRAGWCFILIAAVLGFFFFTATRTHSTTSADLTPPAFTAHTQTKLAQPIPTSWGGPEVGSLNATAECPTNIQNNFIASAAQIVPSTFNMNYTYNIASWTNILTGEKTFLPMGDWAMGWLLSPATYDVTCQSILPPIGWIPS